MMFLNAPLNLKYLVVGTGRCGTMYMAKLLTKMGFPCSHEAVFSHDGIEPAIKRMKNASPLLLSGPAKTTHHLMKASELKAESSYMAAPFLDHPELAHLPLVHVIRHPLKVISSFVVDGGYFQKNVGDDKTYQTFIYSHLPELNKIKTQLERAAVYCMLWNNLIIKHSHNRRYILFRVEDDVNRIAHFVHSDKNNVLLSNNINTWRKKDTIPLTWDDLPTSEWKEALQKFAKRYGYSTE